RYRRLRSPWFPSLPRCLPEHVAVSRWCGAGGPGLLAACSPVSGDRPQLSPAANRRGESLGLTPYRAHRRRRVDWLTVRDQPPFTFGDGPLATPWPAIRRVLRAS